MEGSASTVVAETQQPKVSGSAAVGETTVGLGAEQPPTVSLDAPSAAIEAKGNGPQGLVTEDATFDEEWNSSDGAEESVVVDSSLAPLGPHWAMLVPSLCHTCVQIYTHAINSRLGLTLCWIFVPHSCVLFWVTSISPPPFNFQNLPIF